MEQKLNLSMIRNILTLRYYPSKEIHSFNISEKDFQNTDDKLNLEKIEHIISKDLQNKISQKNISIGLSGGVDSVLVLALLRKVFPDIKINAISIKFSNSVDETDSASYIASQFNVEHHIVTIDNYLEELPKALSIMKMPFWDIHWYYLCKASKNYSNVLVSGDGGDELFGGYTFRYKKFLSKVNHHMNYEDKTKLYLECHERDWVLDQEKIFTKLTNFSWNEIYDYVSPNFQNQLDPIDQVFLADINGKLQYNWNIVNNCFNDFFKIKSVTPLLSNELIQYSLHLKNQLKYDSVKDVGKIPLREILAKYVNLEKITQSKQGFSVNTVNFWNNYGKEFCKYYLSNARIVSDGLINQDWISKHLNLINNSQDVRYVNKFLGLLAVEIWYRIFITKEMSSEDKLQL